MQRYLLLLFTYYYIGLGVFIYLTPYSLGRRRAPFAELLTP